jgi:NTE family protein
MKIGLALSGGGARGFAHLGVAQALYEQGIKPQVYSGTSAGAIVGAFLAAGYLPKRTMEIISEINFLKYFRPAISWKGFVKLEKMTGLLLEYFPENNFESLQFPLTIAATNYTKGQVAFFNKGELITPLLASTSIPVIFDPITIQDDLHIDGGVMCNLPAQKIKNDVDFLIGINCNPISKSANSSSMKDMLERTMLMAINCNTTEQKPFCDLFLEPQKLDQYKVFALSKAKEIYEIGYEYTSKLLQSNPEIFPLSKNKKDKIAQ